MRTLIPPPVTAAARPLTRAKRVFGFALTTRALLLVIARVGWLIPAFFHHQRASG